MEEVSTPHMYRIRIQGNLDPGWAQWLAGMSITTEKTDVGCRSTVLTGSLADQAALRGVLTRLWDLNLDIISVTRIGKQREEA